MRAERKKKILIMLSVWAGCCVGLFLTVYLLKLQAFLPEEAEIPLKLQITGFLLTAAALVFVIVARVKKLENAVRGFFFFELVGIAVFVVCFAMQIAGKNIENSFFLDLFNLWTVLLRPAAYLIAPLIGVSEFLRKALLLILLTYLPGQAYLGIQKQKRFEAALAEKKALEEQSNRARPLSSPGEKETEKRPGGDS